MRRKRMPKGKPKSENPEMYEEREKLQAEPAKDDPRTVLAFALAPNLQERGLFNVVRYKILEDKVLEKILLSEADSKPACLRLMVNYANHESNWPVESVMEVAPNAMA